MTHKTLLVSMVIGAVIGTLLSLLPARAQAAPPAAAGACPPLLETSAPRLQDE